MELRERNSGGGEEWTSSDGVAYVKDGPRTGLGYQKITNLSSAVSLTVPTGAHLALMRVETQDIRFRGDGVNPTATDGMLFKTTDGMFPYTGPLSQFRAIEVVAGAVLHVLYFK